ncbi:MAG: hypothetical protein R3D25_05340 [Geminicoccaceae bacterium]
MPMQSPAVFSSRATCPRPRRTRSRSASERLVAPDFSRKASSSARSSSSNDHGWLHLLALDDDGLIGQRYVGGLEWAPMRAAMAEAA